MLNNRVKEARIRLNLSQVELSRKTKIAAPNISAIENGRLVPWGKAKRTLARVLKITEAELFPEATQETVKNGQ
jgi:ribosome-binding protein aMBF1 (putative translation factor)